MIRKRRNQKDIPTPNTEVGKKLNWQLGTYTKKTYCKPSGQLFPNRRSLSYPNLTTENMKTYIRFKQHKNLLENIKQIEPQQKYRLRTNIKHRLAHPLQSNIPKLGNIQIHVSSSRTISKCCLSLIRLK